MCALEMCTVMLPFIEPELVPANTCRQIFIRIYIDIYICTFSMCICIHTNDLRYLQATFYMCIYVYSYIMHIYKHMS